MIRIGTGGYNHREWIGSFYPMEMGPARYLARYAQEFDFCELQLVSHRLPREEDAERILGESDGRIFFTALAPVRLAEAVQSAGAADIPSVGAGFLLSEGGSPEILGRDFVPDTPITASASCAFALDRPAKSTLPRSPSAFSRNRSMFASLDRLLVRLRDALKPYASAKRFGGVVLPLPAYVAATEETLAAIARAQDRLEGLPLLIEPRDATWMDSQVLSFLRGVGLGFVLADGPGPEGPSYGPDRGGPRPLPARQHVSFVPLTTETTYVRFQGRDGCLGRDSFLDADVVETHDRRKSGPHPSYRIRGRREWRAPLPSEAHRYFYSWEELVSWLPTLRALAARARDLYIVFGNSGDGAALENARMLSRLMGTAQSEGRAASS